MNGKTFLVSQSYEVYARHNGGKEELLWSCDTLEDAQKCLKANEDSPFYSNMYIALREVTLTRLG